jgi:SRSO17 transposase
VDWTHDHNASTKKKSIYSNGAVHISCRVQVGEYSYTFGWRLYLRAKTVRRLNRQRPQGKRLKFKSKYRLAREMLVELKAFIPKGWKVYVMFDSWYDRGEVTQVHPPTGQELVYLVRHQIQSHTRRYPSLSNSPT